MHVTASIDEVREIRWADPDLSWGLAPTMGYLHEGHLSLVRRARQENDRVAASIYVNPAQFAPDEDLDKYPRDLDADLRRLSAEGVDLVFTPTDQIMYPAGSQTTVDVGRVTRMLEGASRPTHFRGVTTIVAKLFNIIQPTRCYFGQKDAQQVVVVRRMVRDLNFNLDLAICPIVREPDGLAMSSRNARLKPAARAQATALFRALSRASEALKGGERNAETLREIMRITVATAPRARLDYVSVAQPDTLAELQQVTGSALFSLAVFFEDVRLIDNMLVEV